MLNDGAYFSASADNEAYIAHINSTPLMNVLLILFFLKIAATPVLTHVIEMDLSYPYEMGMRSILSNRILVNIDIDFDGAILLDGEIQTDPARLEQKLKLIGAISTVKFFSAHDNAEKLIKFSTAVPNRTDQGTDVEKIAVISSRVNNICQRISSYDVIKSAQVKWVEHEPVEVEVMVHANPLTSYNSVAALMALAERVGVEQIRLDAPNYRGQCSEFSWPRYRSVFDISGEK